MSTLNVANISDDQSTLTGSSSNPNDKLNLNTTVDTKFVTNGCAKAFGTCKADGSLPMNVGATLNISSIENWSTGQYQYNYTNNMNTTYVAVSDAVGSDFRNCQVKARNAAHVQTNVRRANGANNGDLIDHANTVIVHGDLA